MKRKIIEEEISKKQLWVITCLIFCVSVMVRFIFANFNKTIIVYPDELRYLHFIMPAFLFEKASMQIKCIALLNCIYASSVVFPVLLLALKILKKGWQIIFAVALSVMMPVMTMSMVFMSENIYYPLCLWLSLLILAVLEEGGGKNQNI